MSFETTSVPAPAPKKSSPTAKPGAQSAPRGRNEVDSDLRIAIHDVASGGPARARNLQDRASREIPKEAKVSFAIALSILVVLAMIPVVNYLTQARPESASKQAVVAVEASRGTAPESNAAKPRSAPSSASSMPDMAPSEPSGEARIEPPMPVPALLVLKGLHSMLLSASHLPPGAMPGRIDPEEDHLPQGSLEGAPAEVLENLQLAQIRVAKQPALALRVTAEQHSAAAYKFELEIVSASANGDELVSRGEIVLVPVNQETMRVIRLDRFEPFEHVGGKVTAATFEQGRAPREPSAATPSTLPAAVPVVTLPESQALVATYPYIIH